MKILDFFLDLLFPPKCIFCGEVLESTNICNKCLEKLPYTKGDSTVQKLPFISKCVSPLYYDGVVRDAILRFKFNGKSNYAGAFAQIMAEYIENNLDCGDISVVSWVPLSRMRMRKRGYNQAQLLAEAIAKRLELPSAPCLVKIKNNTAQSKTTSAEQRRRNVAGAYKVCDPEFVKDKNILLIDDVVTTGSTLSECSRMLQLSGANKVYSASIARHKD